MTKRVLVLFFFCGFLVGRDILNLPGKIAMPKPIAIIVSEHSKFIMLHFKPQGTLPLA